MLYFLGMKDPRLAAALLTSSPDALAELFDAYGDRLFRYCWSMLRSRELAQVALRDTLLVAQAHIARLADPEDPSSLGPWLYSLARAECRRHQAVTAADADESPARLGLPAADARLMSWYAAMSLEAAEFEALDLACRHYVDLAQVLGLPAADAEALLDRARQNLERALGAEILAGRGLACPDRDAMLAGTGLAGTGLAGTGLAGTGLADGRRGPLPAQARERVLEHAAGCATCGPEVPRNVSATRIFALLPAPALTAQDRAEVLTVLAGPQPPAAPALAQAALVPAPAASGLAPALPGPVPAASASVPVPAEPASAPVVPAPGQSALGPSLASYVRAPEPVRVPVASAAAPAAARSCPGGLIRPDRPGGLGWPRRPGARGIRLVFPGGLAAAPGAPRSAADRRGGRARLGCRDRLGDRHGRAGQVRRDRARHPGAGRRFGHRARAAGGRARRGPGLVPRSVGRRGRPPGRGPDVHAAPAGQHDGQQEPGHDHRRYPAAAAGPGSGRAAERGRLGRERVVGRAARAAAVGRRRDPGHRQRRADHPHRDGRDGQLVGQRVPAGPGQPEQLRRHAAGWAERHGDGAGQPGCWRGQRGHLLPDSRLGHGGHPGHLVGAAGRLRSLVAPASVAARSVAFVGVDVQRSRSQPDLVRPRPLAPARAP